MIQAHPTKGRGFMRQRYAGVSVGGYGTLLGAVLLAVSWMFGFQGNVENGWGMGPLWAAAWMALAAWGYLMKLARWGIRFMQIHAGLLAAFSAVMVARYSQLPFLFNVAWGLFALAYTLIKQDSFGAGGVSVSCET